MLIPGSLNPGLMSGGLISELITGPFIWGVISGGIVSGVVYRGTFLQWLISRGIISGGIYPGAYIRRKCLISGAYTGAQIRGTYIRGLLSGGHIWGLIPGQISDGLIFGGLISGAYIFVNRFFKVTVDKVPLKRLYVPELEKKTAVISIRRIALLKGRSSGAILRLREAINSPKWYHAWVKLIPESFGGRGPQKSHGSIVYRGFSVDFQ